jgi:hypothetical protein
MFEVTYHTSADTAAWVNASFDFGDLPVIDIVRDDATGDLALGRMRHGP